MDKNSNTYQQAFAEVSASSAGGSPFLITYGATFLLTGALSFLLPDSTVALIAMFQGVVALPAAFWLERRLGWGRMAADNPLRSLSITLAFSQALALPALIVAFNINPRSIPVILASLAGVHFLPYSWLHRTQLYILLAAVIALGAFGLQLLLGSTAFHINLLFVGIIYWLFAPLVYRHARQFEDGP
ncbi:MAG: hypothetical protein R3293_22625 [Candidatus Promineifilaceae bacterium]|nr:hypothetical protein [Candidatus Promineifilaceae bacterium]